VSESQTSSGGLGFCGALTIAFVVLKLCGVVKWSWLWVLAPAWISAVILMLLLIVMVILAVVCK